jgi:Calcineurin-like phosphoesterase
MSASCCPSRSDRRSRAPPELRTVVVSDLHLGASGDRDVLRDRDCVDALTGALAGAERLVLLGDVVELRDGPLRDALAAASRVLPALSEALRGAREVVIVPGNHDHQLLSGWLERRAAAGPPAPLGLADAVDWIDGEPLASLARALGGARMLVRYPGVWLREDVYATHGHYLDRHTTVPMFERLGAGAMGRLVDRPAAAMRGADDYQAVLAPIYAWLHAVAQTRAGGTGWPGGSTRVWQSLGRGGRRGPLRRRATALGVRAAIGALNRAGLGPLRADLSAAELRRAGLRAFGDVLGALDVRAPFAIFGHTHRAGPLDGDDAGEWISASGVRIVNSGCWVHEAAFLGSRPRESPYRAGFCVQLGETGAPRLVNLLDRC